MHPVCWSAGHYSSFPAVTPTRFPQGSNKIPTSSEYTHSRQCACQSGPTGLHTYAGELRPQPAPQLHKKKGTCSTFEQMHWGDRGMDPWECGYTGERPYAYSGQTRIRRRSADAYAADRSGPAWRRSEWFQVCCGPSVPATAQAGSRCGFRSSRRYGAARAVYT